ncbi:MAG TPA: DegT/DnrJ/EryC1/StrS family aminotransferase [Tepidisphaeraceae bacterium]|jgi:dTDP-4-amino-4,6-dideoxygalactose transaminase
MTTMIEEKLKLALLGGTPIAQRQWPSWPVWDEHERTGLLEVLESGKWWFGEKVQEFERAYAAFHNIRYGVTCTNGTTAIEMALRAVGVKSGDEVIVPAYTFVATASAVMSLGAIPVFADIEPDTLCMDPKDVEKKITPRTKAIIPVHVAGRFADMNQLSAIARQHKLQLIEDAAHAWGSLLDGKGPGTIGRCSTFSFQVSKNITAGEGGILLTNDEELAGLCRSFTHCGRRSGAAWYDHDYLGSNLRLTEFQAAILLAQLGRLEQQIDRRIQSAKILDARLADLPGIRLINPASHMTRRSYHMYIFRVDSKELGISRDRFIEALNAEGIPATRGWYRPLYANGMFQNSRSEIHNSIISPLSNSDVSYKHVTCPVTEQVCRDAIWIPQEVLLAGEKDMEAVARAVEKVVANAGELR